MCVRCGTLSRMHHVSCDKMETPLKGCQIPLPLALITEFHTRRCKSANLDVEEDIHAQCNCCGHWFALQSNDEEEYPDFGDDFFPDGMEVEPAREGDDWDADMEAEAMLE